MESTKAMLVSVETERDEKKLELEELKVSKETLEADLKTTREGLEAHKAEKGASESQLLQVKEEVHILFSSCFTILIFKYAAKSCPRRRCYTNGACFNPSRTNQSR
jgi:hypothetical protein